MFEELLHSYEDWGYMAPSDFASWGGRYCDAGGACWVLLEGVTNDSQIMFGEGMPTVIAIVENTTAWTSTLQVKAWEAEDTPEAVWEIVEFCSDNMASEEMDDEEYAEQMEDMLNTLREEF